MRISLRELRDEDLPVLFEQWADPVAAQMAAFTAPDHMEREAFERRWARLRADASVLTLAVVAADNVASRRVLEKCGFRVLGMERGVAEARAAEIEELVLRLDADAR